MARLNGWQRIGIVASIVWILVAGVIQHNSDLRHADEQMRLVAKECVDIAFEQNKQDSISDCPAEAKKSYELSLQGSLGNVALVSIAPIPLGWLLVYALIGIWRWVKRGF